MTKRQAAFAYFDKGLSSSSPEVKALGLKSHTRYNYFLEWKKAGGVAGTSNKSAGGESIGGIDETKQRGKEAKSPEEEAEVEDGEAGGNELEENKEAKPEEDLEPEESIGGVDESRGKKEGEGKEKKSKYEVTVASEGVRCVVYLSLQTLALYEIAAAKQAQLSKDGEAKLTLGDYLDTCSEQFFKVRNLKLGLVEI